MHPKMAQFLDKSYGIWFIKKTLCLRVWLWPDTRESIDKLRKAIGKNYLKKWLNNTPFL